MLHATCFIRTTPLRHLQASPSYATDFDGRGATGSARRISESGVVNLPGEAEGRGAGMDAERARRKWEQWRLREETAFAKRLREKARLRDWYPL